MRALALAFGMLTWLPVPNVVASDRDLGRAVALFPLVGAALGLLLAGLGMLAGAHLDAYLRAALLVALLAAWTGGLHLDGLADTADAVGASAKLDAASRRARMLEIMKDPHCGAHGALALALAVGVKTLALAAVAPGWGWVLALAVGRLAAALLVVAFPYARPQGLGRAFRDNARAWEVGLAGAAVLGGALALGPQALAACGAALGTALGLGLWMRRWLGGLTGDVYGAAVELAEIAALVVLAFR